MLNILIHSIDVHVKAHITINKPLCEKEMSSLPLWVATYAQKLLGKSHVQDANSESKWLP